MLKVGSFVLGVNDVPRAIRFWSNALKLSPREEPSNDWAVFIPCDGPGPQLAITVVSSEAKTHQRHQLGLYANHQKKEVERLMQLGAQRVDGANGESAIRRDNGVCGAIARFRYAMLNGSA